MTTAALAELARHVGHTMTLDSPTRLRCQTCQQWVRLPSSVPSTSSTSNDFPSPSEECPRHRGEWSHSCRCCRSEQLEAPPAVPVEEPRFEPSRGYLEASRSFAEACRRKLRETSGAVDA